MSSGPRQPGAARVFTDAPLGHQGHDALHRGPFVSATARLLRDVLATEESVVAALVGPWGSGKSSTLERVLRALSLEPAAVVVPINPWMVSGPEQVAEELVTAVSAGLAAAGVPPRVVKASRRYFRTVVDAAVRGAGSVGGAVAEQYGLPAGAQLGSAAGEALVDLLAAGEKPTAPGVPARTPPGIGAPATLQQASSALAAELSKAEAGVLVVIDDVDRLQPDELLSLFKAVRLLGRLPYVHHLLVYDEETLLDLLVQTPVASGRRDRALTYLEKVVPLRLEQPEISEDHIDALLAEGYRGLKDALPDLPGPSVDDAFGLESELLLRHVLTTPRVIHRFFAQLLLTTELVGVQHVDVADLAVLTLLRLHQPELYRAVSAERRLLTGGEPDDVDGGERADRMDEVLRAPEGVAPQRWAVLAEAVARTFPRAVHSPAGAQLLLDDSSRPQRAADPDFVDRYFALSPLEGDLGSLDVRAGVRDAAAGRTGDDVEGLLAVLSPHRADRRAVSAARRLLRRMADVVATEPLSAVEAARLLTLVCDRAPLPSVDGADTEQPAAVLVGHLLAHVAVAPDPGWADLVDGVSSGSGLRLLTRALSGALPVSAVTTVSGLRAPLVDAVWTHVLAHGSDGGADLGAWVARNAEAGDLAVRVRAALDDGVPVLDLVARLLPLRASPLGPGAVAELDEPDTVDAVVDAVGVERVDEQWSREQLESAAAEGVPGDPRRVAAQVLLRESSPSRRRAPRGELVRSTLAGAAAYEQSARETLDPSDVRIVMTVAAPSAVLPLVPLEQGPALPDDPGWSDRWERQVRAALDASAAAAWLSGARDDGGAEDRVSWQEEFDPGRRAAFSAGGPSVPPREDDYGMGRVNGPRARRTAFCQALTGTAPPSSSPVAAVVVGLGIDLPTIQVRQRSGNAKASTSRRALPMSLTDVAAALLALLRSARLAIDALAPVPGAEVAGGPGGTDGVVHLMMTCGDDIAALVDLGLADRKRSAQRTQFQDSSVTEAPTMLVDPREDAPSARHVRRLLGRWLREAGYRDGVDDAVRVAVAEAVGAATVRPE